MVLDIGGPQNPYWGNVVRKISMKIYLKFMYSKVLRETDVIIMNSKEQLNDDNTLIPYKDKIFFVPKGLDFDY